MKSENKLFPGRESYIGPTTGWFGLLHHSVLCEKSHDIMFRVDYVRREKPENERAIRLHNMIYLGDVGEHYKTKCALLYADYEAKRTLLDAGIFAYIKSHIQDCAWDGKELHFGKTWGPT